MKSRTVKKKVRINASVNDVWYALTNKELAKQFFFDADIDTDWKEGSTITFSGEWEGKKYEDKGVILEVDENRVLRHTYWSSLSGTPDTPEHYFKVSYELEPKGDDKTLFTVSQTGSQTIEAAEQAAENWEKMLARLKEVAEKVVAHSH